MSNGLWNKRKRIQEVKQDAKILLDLKEENNFLYEILTDDNLDNYDARLKISRMNLLFALQKILYQKRLSERRTPCERYWRNQGSLQAYRQGKLNALVGCRQQKN